MKTTKIQELEVPRVALGTWSWGFGGVAGGDTIFGNKYDKNDLKPVFEKAIELGLNLFDTATIYASGASETILGEFIKESQNNVIVSTKFTPQMAEGKGENAVEELFNESRKRLNIDIIDIYWIHNTLDVEKWTEKLIPLLQSGKVKKVGVSNHNLEQIKYVNDVLTKAGYKLHAIQNHYSLLYRNIETTGILDYCKENDIAVFSYMVLEQGALSGKYTKDNPLPEGSRRGQAFPPEVLAKLQPLFYQMTISAGKYGVTIPELVTAWAVSKGTIPIIGVTKVNQVEDAARATNIELRPEDIEMLDRVAKNTGVTVKGDWETSIPI